MAQHDAPDHERELRNLRHANSELSRALVNHDKDRNFRSVPMQDKMIGGSDVCATCEAHCIVMIEDEEYAASQPVHDAPDFASSFDFYETNDPWSPGGSDHHYFIRYGTNLAATVEVPVEIWEAFREALAQPVTAESGSTDLRVRKFKIGDIVTQYEHLPCPVVVVGEMNDDGEWPVAWDTGYNGVMNGSINDEAVILEAALSSAPTERDAT